MSLSNSVFNNLRQKLDALGYSQTLPPTAIPLVGALFEDLIKTTESLRDSKKRIGDLLEEKSCWELGVEPYKCDNARLLSECNHLHMQTLKEREDFEERTHELSKKIRCLECDKQHLEEQCQHLQYQLKTLMAKECGKVSGSSGRHFKEGKKPFISTVRSGDLPPLKPLSEIPLNMRCTKCNAGYYQRSSNVTGSTQTSNTAEQKELNRMEKQVKDATEQLAFYKRKIDARNREIRRLNDMLTGGRPPVALAKDCCYKDVGALSEDIDILQREKSETLCKMREYQNQMHEAMQRSTSLEERNRALQLELEELRKAALLIEMQANKEMEANEEEIKTLQQELAKLRAERTGEDHTSNAMEVECGTRNAVRHTNQRHINERLNELTQRETTIKHQYESAQKKIQKLKNKVSCLQKELDSMSKCKGEQLDEQKIRLKSERDFFQKEYLHLLTNAGSKKEMEFLQCQLKAKDEELQVLRQELCLCQQVSASAGNMPSTAYPSVPATARTELSNASVCVQAVVLRAERERDCARAELERVRCERDMLREKHICMTQMQAEESEKTQQRINELTGRIHELEQQKRELNSERLPHETQIVLLKEEVHELKLQICDLQQENQKLKSSYNQLRVLNEQTERSLGECQNKLIVAERQLESADIRLNCLDSNRETTRTETTQLRHEVAALKCTYVALEQEKDRVTQQLDDKTERACQLEYELKSCKEKRMSLENDITDLKEKLQKLNMKVRENDSQLHATSTESKSLRNDIVALMTSRDEAISENGRLCNDLAECRAEILTLKKKLKDSETEIERLKLQLRQYVQEVKKAEDLLLNKEKEREEMLEHYRSLSHDAVLLEGNNQSLEVEAAEYKRQLKELEVEIEALKKDICCRNSIIEQLEDKVTGLSSQNACLERQLDEAIGDQRLLKVDLAARKELCDKLDIQKDKLNAELHEVNEIRRKLQRDIEKLRNELEKTASGNKASAETFEELLSKTRRDLEEQIKADSKLGLELLRLRQENEELLQKLDSERSKRYRNEHLMHEYEVQNQELRHNITDDRFRQARSREQSPHFGAQTM